MTVVICIVTTARLARLRNCYKKARKWDREGMVRVLTNKLVQARTCS